MYRQFTMDLQDLDRGRVEIIFERHGALSITLTGASDNPVLEPPPGETPLWRDVRITGLFTLDADLDALIRDLEDELAVSKLPAFRIEALADRDWEREWLKGFDAMRFGRRLWVRPGDAEIGNPDAVVVTLDPGLAFGTGTHATTALCLEWLDGLDLTGKRVLDFGCGSGILAIAALKLGAAGAAAVDIDEQALRATQSNAEQNAVAARLETCASPADVSGIYEIVVANILAEPLLELAEFLVTRLSSGGDLALSGILSGQVNKIQAAYSPWIVFDEPAHRSQGGQDWALLSGKRRAT